MKLLLLIVSTLFFEKVYSFSFSQKKYERLGDDLEISMDWIEQPLDHFNADDTRTWNQRYYVNTNHFNVLENVAFLFLNGEVPLNYIKITASSWVDYAKHFQAICFNLEHRYYGESHPTEDLSTENLRYLSSIQVLADTENFIRHVNIKYNLSGVKWILFGESYAGSLAAWMRRFYPNIIHGAVSVSAPLLAKFNFEEFYNNVYDVLRIRNPGCLEAIQRAITQVEKLMRDQSDQRRLTQLLKLCQPLEEHVDNIYDIGYLFITLASMFSQLIMEFHNYDESFNIDSVCQIMTDQLLGAEWNRLAIVNRMNLDHDEKSCITYSFDEWITWHRNTDWNEIATVGYRQWLYQQCTEFGLFQTSDHQPQIFGNKFPLVVFIKLCQRTFGERFNYELINNAVNRINDFYHGLNIDASNVVFVYGEYDPWKTLGLTESTRNGITVIKIDGGFHCESYFPPTPSDSQNLINARETIQQLIRDWLDD